MPTGDKPLDATKLVVGVVGIISSSNALAMQFERLARDLGIGEGAPMIMFYSGVKKILRELPDKAFIDKNARFALVDAVQDALDEAIEVEENIEENRVEGDR